MIWQSNYMKNFLFVIFVLFTFFASAVRSVAQEVLPMLVVVSYESREDIDFLFANSTRVLEYLEGEDVEKPILLSLVSTGQYESIKEEGYEISIIDQSADITSYVLLYHPVEDQSILLADEYRVVIPISKHYVFIKLAPNQEFSHTGAAAAFFDIPFSEVVVTPPLRTKEAAIPTSAPATAPVEPIKTQTILLPIIVGLLIFVPIVIFAIIIIIKRKQKSKIVNESVLPETTL